MIDPVRSPASEPGSTALPPLTALCLSLSSACGADCIFCPEDRGTRIKTKVMSFEIATKAIDDACVRTEVIQVETFSFGENGDAYINKRALDIFRYAKTKHPASFRLCITDLQNLPADKMEEIFRDDLLSSMDFNIDGATPHSFYATKRLTIDHVNAKLPLMLELRERYRSNMRIVISVLPVRKYVDSTLRKLGKLPAKMTDQRVGQVEDDTAQILEVVAPLLRSTDLLYGSEVVHWAERGQVDVSKLDYSQYKCPLIDWVSSKAYIAPNGEWYACCLDSNNELVLGNVMQESLHDLAVGAPRKLLLDRLARQEFAKIGGPCRTVNCCQSSPTSEGH